MKSKIKKLYLLFSVLLISIEVRADNCSGLSDCYGYILAAVLAALLIALAIYAIIAIAAAAEAAATAAAAEAAAAAVVAEAEAAFAVEAAAMVAEGVSNVQIFARGIQILEALPAAHRAASFSRIAGIIETASSGSWSVAESVALSDGGMMYMGGRGSVIVFDSAGNMFMSRITSLMNSIATGEAPVYSTLETAASWLARIIG